MSTMTFRAGDNATALELVERRFGGDALILSTVYVDGRVEITATDEVPPLANAGTHARPRRRIDVTLDEDVTFEEPAKQTPPKATEPQSSNNDAHLPSFLRRAAPRPFAAVLDDALQTGQTPLTIKPKTTPVARQTAAELRVALLAASRIILVGPCGAGKTQMALQLALLCRDHRPDTHVSFIFCGTGSRADGAVLAQKSHLLGMNTTFNSPSDLDLPSRDRIEIVLLSGRISDAVPQACSLLSAPDTRALLVIPDGLRPDRIKRLAAQWSDITTLAGLGHVAKMDRAEAESSVSAKDELDLLWLSDPDALVDGLLPVGGDSIPVPISPPLGETGTLSTPQSSESAKGELNLPWQPDSDTLIDGICPVGTDGVPVPVYPPLSETLTLSVPNQPTPKVMFRSNQKTPEAWS